MSCWIFENKVFIRLQSVSVMVVAVCILQYYSSQNSENTPQKSSLSEIPDKSNQTNSHSRCEKQTGVIIESQEWLLLQMCHWFDFNYNLTDFNYHCVFYSK